MNHSLSDVLVAFRDAVVVEAVVSVVFDADVEVELPTSPVVAAAVFSAVSSDVGAVVVVFVGSSLAPRKPTVSISLCPSRGIRAASVTRPGTRRMTNASKGKNRILSRYGGQGGRNVSVDGLGDEACFAGCNGNQDLEICAIVLCPFMHCAVMQAQS